MAGGASAEMDASMMDPASARLEDGRKEEEISRLEEQAASFLVALRRTEKQLEAKTAESLRLEAELQELTQEVERQRQQNEQYRQITNGQHGAVASSISGLGLGAMVTPGSSRMGGLSSLAGMSVGKSPLASGVSPTSLGRPGTRAAPVALGSNLASGSASALGGVFPETLLVEARRELERVKLTHQSLSRQVQREREARAAPTSSAACAPAFEPARVPARPSTPPAEMPIPLPA